MPVSLMQVFMSRTWTPSGSVSIIIVVAAPSISHQSWISPFTCLYISFHIESDYPACEISSFPSESLFRLSIYSNRLEGPFAEERIWAPKEPGHERHWAFRQLRQRVE